MGKDNDLSMEDANLFLQDADVWIYEIVFRVFWLDLFLDAGNRLVDGEKSPIVVEHIFVKSYGLLTEFRHAMAYHFLCEMGLSIANSELLEGELGRTRTKSEEEIFELISKLERSTPPEALELIELFRNRATHVFTEGYLASMDPNTLKVRTSRIGEIKADIRDRCHDRLEEAGGYYSFALIVFMRLKDIVIELREKLLERVKLLKAEGLLPEGLLPEGDLSSTSVK